MPRDPRVERAGLHQSERPRLRPRTSTRCIVADASQRGLAGAVNFIGVPSPNVVTKGPSPHVADPTYARKARRAHPTTPTGSTSVSCYKSAFKMRAVFPNGVSGKIRTTSLRDTSAFDCLRAGRTDLVLSLLSLAASEPWPLCNYRDNCGGSRRRSNWLQYRQLVCLQDRIKPSPLRCTPDPKQHLFALNEMIMHHRVALLGAQC